MQINVSIDPSQLQAKTLREQKRLAFNTAEALNNTAKDAQDAIRRHMQEVFKLRATPKKDRNWLLQRIKINFASVKQGRIVAEVYVDQKARLLLGGFETGEERTPFAGQNVAVPNPAVARDGNIDNPVDPSLTFRNLKLKPVKVQPNRFGDTVQFKGQQRTFILKHTASNPFGGVYQRVGPGKDDIRLVYSFRRPFHLKSVLDFVKIATAVMQDKFAVEFAISNARRPSV